MIKEKKNLQNVEGVKKVCYRLAINTMMRTAKENYYSSRLHSYGQDDFQKFYVWEEAENQTQYEEVFVEYKFAQSKNIKAGDIIQFKINDTYESFFISKVVSLPEAIAIEAFVGLSEIVSDFGYFYFSQDIIETRFPQYADYYNEILLDFEENANPDVVLKNVEELLGKENVKNSFTYDDSAVKVKLNIKPMETVSVFLPIVFFVTILIVVFLFMSLMIGQCRREIGILRAIGFDKEKIWLLFALINLIVAVFEVILGTILGFFLLKFILNLYLGYFAIPKSVYVYTINFKIYIVSVVLTFIVGQISTLLCMFNISRIEPVEAMTRENVAEVKVPKWIYALTKPLKPFTKFCVITGIKNKFKFILSTICISFSVMLIVASFSIITSKNYILTETFEKRTNYDAQVFFSKKPNAKQLQELRELENVERIENVKIYNATIEKNGKSESIVINAISIDSECVNIYNLKEEKIVVPKSGIILEKNVADRLNVRIGDFVNVEGISFEVKEISSQCLNKTNYISLEASEELGKGIIDTIYVNVKVGTEQELVKYLSEQDNYLYSVFSQNIYHEYIRSFQSYDIAAWINIVFAILIGGFIVFNTVITSILENQKKLCAVRVLGFQFGEVSRNFFVQIFMEYVLACMIGIVTGSMIAKKLLDSICTLRREYKYVNGPKEYLISIGIVVLFLVVSHILAMRMFQKWDLEEVIKEKE